MSAGNVKQIQSDYCFLLKPEYNKGLPVLFVLGLPVLIELVLYWQECISGEPSTTRSCVLLKWTSVGVS